MIETQLGPQRNDFVRPPSDADGMLRVSCRVTGATANDVVVKLISHSEKRARRDSEHGVIENAPFRRIPRLHRKRTALEWHFRSGMCLRVEHVHVERFSRGIDFVDTRKPQSM